ncbi:uncharacterized protein LOC132031835 [Lycium ferocissimum]|uniref:uncharacterized protein LOC132031835 n=1 Tax=Lycium ferocissimum TaxID=112874 RepID=UPI0028163D48|nr:uncharacterized protein LOC132031835 [Lycium ferocissimum]
MANIYNDATCDNCQIISNNCNERCFNESFSKPMPTIGVYVAVASLLCTLAMAVDAFLAFRLKRLWFPCKLFALNAASLTVLAVAMKLPVDISDPMPGDTYRLLFIKMNFVYLQLFKVRIYIRYTAGYQCKKTFQNIVFMCVVICNFMPSVGSMSNKEILSNVIALDILVITIIVNLCIEMGIGLIFSMIPEYILIIFFMTISELGWFIFISFKRSNNAGNANANFSRVEYYWIDKLVEWKERPLSLNIRGTKFRKYRGTRNLFLSFCIRTQILVVSMSKFVRFVSVVSFNLMFTCQLQGPNYHQSEPELGKDSEYHRYVLLLEGEEEMPERIFKNISGTANQLVDTGRKRQPKHLINLLRKSSSFSGVADIYCDQVPALHSVEPSNCWTLSVVTLTSIAVALPKVRNQMAHQLIRSVHGGLKYASFVEETMYPEDRFTNIRNVAHTVWEELEFHRKWLDEDLQKLTLEGKTFRGTLEILTRIVSKKVMDFKQTSDGRMLDNPLNWPIRIIAANSMYKIGKAILLNSEGHHDLVDEKLFERLSITIADILSACFPNLPRAITMICNSSTIEEREKSVCRATLLVGKTEDILKIIQRHELPNINSDQSAYIDQWKLVLQQKNLVPAIPSNGEIAL